MSTLKPHIAKISRPYAQAAFEYASAQKTVAQWSHALNILSQYIQNEQLESVLKDPRSHQQDCAQWLCTVVSNLDTSQKNFILTLAARKRLETLPAIYDLFEVFKAASEDILQVKVEAVCALSEIQKEALNHRLGQSLGRRIVVTYDINPELLGGLVIYMGDRVLDSSLRGRFERIRGYLQQ